MPATNATAYYGHVTKVFHWLTALLIVTLIPLGLIADALPFDTQTQLSRKAAAFSLHKTLGVAVFVVALARIAWALTQTKPAPLHPDRKVETWLAETVHWLLYGSLVLVPLSGWVGHAAAEGFAPIWWPLGQSLPFVPKSPRIEEIASTLHYLSGRVLIAALALHIAGALKHHVVDRDATLRRMWFGHTETPGASGTHPRALPFATALGIWAAALGLGAMLGFFDAHNRPAATAQLQDVASEWTVEEGTIEIIVNQFGSDVTGRFADWTAAIRFDETVENGPAGSVTATIAIASLALGSVTDQAMGPDFFDAETFATAVFDAEIITVTDSTTARGTLTIKDNSVPVDLPFDLVVDGDTARMTGLLTLDRRSFGIGDTITDESTLRFPVTVNVTLTATRE